MAVKTITIDMEAYEVLASRKRAGESFSQVIKRTFAEERYTARNLLEHLDQIRLPAAALDSIEDTIRSRDEDLVAEPTHPYDA